jgi:hypothetical protein
MVGTETFEYRPLKESDGIRLFEVRPAGSLNDGLAGRLVHTTLKGCRNEVIHHFTALSYVWGSASNVVTIFVEGKLFSVTRTLDTALRHLRDSTRVIRIWADAICINQKDNDERAVQVQLMGDIYRTAHHTVIFLGEADENTDWVFKWIDDNAPIPPLFTEVLLQGLGVLLQRPWFYRIWVYQELILSSDPRVQCGHRRCSWDSFYRFCEVYYYRMSLTGSASGEAFDFVTPPSEAVITTTSRAHLVFRTSLMQMQLARAKYKKIEVQKSLDYILDPAVYHSGVNEGGLGIKPEDPYHEILSNFIDILVSRRGFGVSDPRDMIYAHTSLVHNLKIGNPNYNHSIPQVFEDLARHHMNGMRGYQILSFIEYVEPYDRRQGLRSWVPDWTRTSIGPPLRIMEFIRSDYEFERSIKGMNEEQLTMREFERSKKSMNEEQLIMSMTGKNPSWWKVFHGPLPINGLLCDAGYVTHTVRDVSGVLDDTDIIPPDMLMDPNAPDFSNGVWGPFDHEKAFLLWQRKLGDKDYMLPFTKGSAWDPKIMCGVPRAGSAWDPKTMDGVLPRVGLDPVDVSIQSVVGQLLVLCHSGRPEKTIVRGRRLAVLENIGTQPPSTALALLPPTARYGDVVCFLRSCTVPFVMRRSYPDQLNSLNTRVRDSAKQGRLRPSEVNPWSPNWGSFEYRDGEDWDVEHFTMVGECFVEDMMCGKAVELSNESVYSRIGRVRLIVVH